jgi:hypothetical protein
MGEDETEPAPIIRAGFAVDGDVIDVAEGGASFPEAEVDRLGRQPGPMLNPTEAFFLGRRDEAAVFHDARGGIGVPGVKAED